MAAWQLHICGSQKGRSVQIRRDGAKSVISRLAWERGFIENFNKEWSYCEGLLFVLVFFSFLFFLRLLVTDSGYSCWKEGSLIKKLQWLSLVYRNELSSLTETFKVLYHRSPTSFHVSLGIKNHCPLDITGPHCWFIPTFIHPLNGNGYLLCARPCFRWGDMVVNKITPCPL